jgi:hypothetical protein
MWDSFTARRPPVTNRMSAPEVGRRQRRAGRRSCAAGPPRPAPRTTDRTVPVDAHASHLVSEAANEPFDANDVFTPTSQAPPTPRAAAYGSNITALGRSERQPTGPPVQTVTIRRMVSVESQRHVCASDQEGSYGLATLCEWLQPVQCTAVALVTTPFHGPSTCVSPSVC